MADLAMTVAEFRRNVRAEFPHVKVSVRTVDFTDLLRKTAKCLRVEGDRSVAELDQINAWASKAGIIPDSSFRFYGDG